MIRPPADVQKRIADYLDAKCAKIDAIIAKQQEIIEKLKAYKLSIITEAVTKGLNPDVPMKDSGISWLGDIPLHWELRRTKSVAVIIDCKFSYDGSFQTDYENGSTGNIYVGGVEITSVIDTYFQNRDVIMEKLKYIFEGYLSRSESE